MNGRDVDLQITPFKVGTEVQAVALATYPGDVTKDVTNEAVWTSSDESLATVSATGFIRGMKVGSVTIWATVGSIRGRRDLTVQPPSVQPPSLPTTGPPSIAFVKVEPEDGVTLKRGDFGATKVYVAYSRGGQTFTNTLWIWACLGDVDKPDYFISTTCQAVSTDELDRDPYRYLNPAIGYRPGDESINKTTKVVIYLVDGNAALQAPVDSPYKPEKGWPIVAKAEKSVTWNWK